MVMGCCDNCDIVVEETMMLSDGEPWAIIGRGIYSLCMVAMRRVLIG